MNNESGATTLETAITILPFLILVLGFIQICLIAFSAFSVQYAVNRSVRWGVTDSVLVPGETRFESIQNRLTQELQTLTINTDNLQVNMCNGAVSNCTGQDAGGSSSFVTLQATVPVYSFFGGNFQVTGTAVAKNEPF